MPGRRSPVSQEPSGRWGGELPAGLVLAGVALAALFASPFAASSFTPGKAALVRLVGLLAAAGAAGVWILDNRRDPAPARPGSPILHAALAVAVVVLFSCLASASPLSVFWGSPDRLEGGVDQFCLVGLAFFAWRYAGTGFLPRLALGATLVAAPVALLALFQAAGLDPGGLLGEAADRAGSTLGNAVLLGDWLAVAAPFSWSLAASYLKRGKRPAAAAASFICLLEAAALAASGSRGPFLALLGAGGVYAVLLLLARGAASRARLLILVLLVGSLIVAALAASGLTAGGGRGEGLSRLADLGAGGETVRQRFLVYGGAAALIRGSSPEAGAPKAPEPSIFRLLVGHGPGSFKNVFSRAYPPSLARFTEATPASSHNLALDVLATTGLAGLLAWLWLYGAIFTRGCALCAARPGSRPRLGGQASFLFPAGALLGGLAGLLYDQAWLGLGIGLGMAAGGLALLGATAWKAGHQRAGDGASSLFTAAAVASVVARFLALQTGVPGTASALLFWLAVAGLAMADSAESATDSGAIGPAGSNTDNTAALAGVTVAAGLGCLFFSLPLLLRTGAPPAAQWAAPIFASAGLFWLAGMAMAADSKASARGYALISLGGAALLLGPVAVTAWASTGPAQAALAAFPALAVGLAGLAAALAASRGARGAPRRPGPRHGFRPILAGAACLLILALAWPAAIRPLVASSWQALGLQREAAGDLAGAEGDLFQAALTARDATFVTPDLVRVLLTRAGLRDAEAPGEASKRLEAALLLCARARNLNMDSPEPRVWTARVQESLARTLEGNRKAAALELAAGFWAEASERSPGNVRYLGELALANLAAGKPVQALETAERAVELDPLNSSSRLILARVADFIDLDSLAEKHAREAVRLGGEAARAEVKARLPGLLKSREE